MKKITTISLVTAMILAMVASCDQAQPQDTTPSSDTASTEESSIITTTEASNTGSDSEPDETQETKEKDPPTAYWFDSNFNFSHDPGDYYYIDCEQVSMSGYYEALDQNKDVYPAFDAVSTLNAGRICEELLYKEDSVPMEDCDLVSMKKITVQIAGEEGEVDVEGRVPQINIRSKDADKVNKEILKTIKNETFLWGGTPKTRYLLIDHDDGSKTLLWYYFVQEEMIYKAYTFDSKGHLMTTDEILKTIGYGKKDFMKAATQKLQRDLDLADIYNIHKYGGCTSAYTMKRFKEDPELFINESGQVILILRYDFDPWVGDGWFGLLYPCEFQIEKQDKINSCQESLDILNNLDGYTDLDFDVSSCILNNDLAFVHDVEDDEANEDADEDEEDTIFTFVSSTNIKDFDTKTVPGYIDSNHLCFFDKDGHTGFMACSTLYSKLLYCKVGLPEAISDKGSYRYEVYKDGKVVGKGTITEDGDHSYQSLSFCCEPVKDGPCCVVVYERDKYDEGSVLAAGWYELQSLEW
ncbi:MAG: hypothetical protein J6X33_00370 [Clostridiales bacterium]|nr:hypothetical protein [Clostridiales bacterium]